MPNVNIRMFSFPDKVIVRLKFYDIRQLFIYIKKISNLLWICLQDGPDI